MHSIILLLCEIAVILTASRIVGMIAVRLGQPQVVGEMLAGVMLGPSLLGIIWPGAFATLFPPGSLGGLNLLSQVGIILFLFLIGLELDPKLVRGRGRAAIFISQTSIVVPLLLGGGLTWYFFHRGYFESSMPFLPVALFMGAAMSVTAFPVLARILTERNLHKTRIGAIAITCAAVNDVSAWCLLAFVVAVAKAEGSMAAAGVTVLLSLAYIAIMLLAVRPFLVRLENVFERQGRLSQNIVAVILVLVLLSSIATQWIGIHALFGAFMLGAVMPKGTRFVRTLTEKLEDFTIVFLLPLFFAYTGLKTQIGLLDSSGMWLDAGLIVVVACLGKFGGSTVAARACGLQWREASALGILMNTRGLMELVILQIGSELDVITPRVFAMMVMMAIVTTCLTTPILSWVYPRRLFERDEAGDTPSTAAPAVPRAFSVLIPVSFPRSGGPLLHLASLVTGPEQGRIVALHLRRPVDREGYRADFHEANKTAQDESLEPLIARARQGNIDVEPISFATVDVSGDIAQVADEKKADLVLIGFHNPVFGHALLGGTVARVMRETERDIAVFINRGFDGTKKLLVPFLGTVHDRLALELAGRIARSSGATITLLHVVPPGHGHASQQNATKVFEDPSLPEPVEVRTVESATPVSAVLSVAAEFDLVVIGVAERWGLESRLFGLRAERIARDCPSSLLIVRKYVK